MDEKHAPHAPAVDSANIRTSGQEVDLADTTEVSCHSSMTCKELESLVQSQKNQIAELQARLAALESEKSKLLDQVREDELEKRLAILKQGTVAAKFHYRHLNWGVRLIKVAKEKYLSWSTIERPDKKSILPLNRIIGVLFGYKSKNFQIFQGSVPYIRGKLLAFNEWQCLSIVSNDRSIDLAFYDEEHAIVWALGIQEYIENPISLYTRSYLLARRAHMKLSAIARRKGLSKASFLCKFVREWTEKRRIEFLRKSRSVFTNYHAPANLFVQQSSTSDL